MLEFRGILIKSKNQIMANTIIAKLEFIDKTIHLVIENVVFLVHDKEDNSVSLAVGIDNECGLKSTKFTGDECDKVMDLFERITEHTGYQIPGLKPIPDFIWFSSENFSTVFNMAYIATIIEVDDMLTIHFKLGIEPFTIKKTDDVLKYLDERSISIN